MKEEVATSSTPLFRTCQTGWVPQKDPRRICHVSILLFTYIMYLAASLGCSGWRPNDASLRAEVFPEHGKEGALQDVREDLRELLQPPKKGSLKTI